MPSLDATTTLAFAAAGIDASTLYGLLQYVASYSISVMIWVFKAFLPIWLVLGIIAIIVGLVAAFVRFGRHGH